MSKKVNLKLSDGSTHQLEAPGNPKNVVQKIVRDNGIWLNDKYIPYHSIVSAEIVDETDNS